MPESITSVHLRALSHRSYPFRTPSRLFCSLGWITPRRRNLNPVMVSERSEPPVSQLLDL